MEINIPRYHKGGSKGWVLDEDVCYYSPRYKKKIYIPKGYESDGATGALDIRSLGWWVHDKMCEDMKWADGTPATRWQGSTVLSDILKDEGRYFRKTYWRYATMLPYFTNKILGVF